MAFAAGIVFWKKSQNMTNAMNLISTAFGFKIDMQKRSCRGMAEASSNFSAY
jgi:hypothetical protein